MKKEDQVVCIVSHADAKKGQEYVIKDMAVLSCGCVAINVGIKTGHYKTFNCPMHNSKRENAGGYHWHDIRYFSPVQKRRLLRYNQIEKVIEENVDHQMPKTTEV